VLLLVGMMMMNGIGRLLVETRRQSQHTRWVLLPVGMMMMKMRSHCYWVLGTMKSGSPLPALKSMRLGMRMMIKLKKQSIQALGTIKTEGADSAAQRVPLAKIHASRCALLVLRRLAATDPAFAILALRHLGAFGPAFATQFPGCFVLKLSLISFLSITAEDC
jgi:hypothetical protein